MYLHKLPAVDQRVIRTALSGALHHFPFYGLGNARYCCGVSYEIDHYAKDIAAACVLAELTGNPGTSVTHYAEQLATTLYGLMHKICEALPVEAVRFYECYPASPERAVPTIDRITFVTAARPGRTVFLSPHWQRVHLAVEPRMAG